MFSLRANSTSSSIVKQLNHSRKLQLLFCFESIYDAIDIVEPLMWFRIELTIHKDSDLKEQESLLVSGVALGLMNCNEVMLAMLG